MPSFIEVKGVKKNIQKNLNSKTIKDMSVKDTEESLTKILSISQQEVCILDIMKWPKNINMTLILKSQKFSSFWKEHGTTNFMNTFQCLEMGIMWKKGQPKTRDNLSKKITSN